MVCWFVAFMESVKPQQGCFSSIIFQSQCREWRCVYLYSRLMLLQFSVIGLCTYVQIHQEHEIRCVRKWTKWKDEWWIIQSTSLIKSHHEVLRTVGNIHCSKKWYVTDLLVLSQLQVNEVKVCISRCAYTHLRAHGAIIEALERQVSTAGNSKWRGNKLH